MVRMGGLRCGAMRCGAVLRGLGAGVLGGKVSVEWYFEWNCEGERGKV